MRKNMNKTILIFLILFFNINLFSAAYEDDAAKVDFYVPGILANDAMSNVNFLLCFLSNTKVGSFANAGPYKALIDEKSCEKADGSDATAELQKATGGSAATSSASAATAVEEITYSPGILDVTTNADGQLTGKAWFDIVMEIGESNTGVPATAYVNTVVTADKDETAGRPYGNFTMVYELKTQDAASFEGQTIPAGHVMGKGYLNILGTTIKFYSEQAFYPASAIVADVANNKKDGFLLSNIKKIYGNNGVQFDDYQTRYKIFQDNTNKVYCQNFENAVKYEQTSNGLVPTTTTYANSAAFDAEIAGVFTTPPTAYLQTQGGTQETVTGEHCWSTDLADATRQIYEYGTYVASGTNAGAIYDLTNSSLTLEANVADNLGESLSRNVHAHASYYGTHVNDVDRSMVTDNTVFKNQRNSADTDSYNLRKNYYRIRQQSISTTSLSALDGVSFQWWMDWMKNDPELNAKIGSAGLNWPTSGACNVAEYNCPEYAGTISVVAQTGGAARVTFRATHGMDWSQNIAPFELTSPLIFTSDDWAVMSDGNGRDEGVSFFDPDSRDEYVIPYSAFAEARAGNVTNLSVKLTTETNVDIDTLNGKTFLCIEHCLSSVNLNDALAEAFNQVDANASPTTLEKTPYFNKGPYFKEPFYYDDDGNGDQNGFELTQGAGRYNNIGGVLLADLSSYSVNNGIIVAADGNIDWSADNKTKLDSSSYRDGIRDFKYKSKEPTYTEDNWTNHYGHSFNMLVVESTDQNNLLCATEVGAGRPHGYDVRYRSVANDQSLLTEDTYYCARNFWEKDLTTYRIELTKGPEYKIYNLTQGQLATISAPKSYEYTVPANGITYNFANTNRAGKKYTLKLEGYGNLQNFPGKVLNTCTGETVGRYVDSWNQCYRFVHEFILPDGAVLTDKSGSDDIKVRALKGDDYLKKLTTSQLPTNRTYTKTFEDLPTSNDLVAVSTVNGEAPTTGIINNGRTSVIHGEIIIGREDTQ